MGAFMLVLGLEWIVGNLMTPPTTSSSLLFTLGTIVRIAWFLGFVFVLLSFPHGRLSGWPDRLLVGAMFVVAVPLQIAWLLFWERPQPPMNAFLVWPSDQTADLLEGAQSVGLWAVSAGLVGLTVIRWRSGGWPRRRALAPVLAGGLTLLVFSGWVVAVEFWGTQTSWRWVVFVGFTAVPIALLVTMLRARLARSAVGDLLIDLRANPAPDALRDALARALGDPSLALAFWLPEFETYADLDGRPMELPPERDGRATTLIDREDEHVAALLHDAALSDEPALLESVSAAAAMALENARLHAELRARLEELKGSRARIVEAAQSERQRLERNLHDGAQQRLVAISLELGRLEARAEADPEMRELVERTKREAEESLRELRELARGIHPALVTDHGLVIALEALVARSPIAVDLDVELERRLPEAVEVAAYYLVSECITNVAKYARASTTRVAVSESDGRVVVEVTDDGVGGANTSGGSGLRGLADRLEALDGRLRVWSPVGGGTRVRAEMPCA